MKHFSSNYEGPSSFINTDTVELVAGVFYNSNFFF